MFGVKLQSVYAIFIILLLFHIVCTVTLNVILLYHTCNVSLFLLQIVITIVCWLLRVSVTFLNMSVRESFNPESYELDKNFRLTRFTELKGMGCKVPQDVLQKLLESLQENHYQEDDQFLGAVMPRLGT